MDERNNDFDFDFMPIGQAIKKAREARGMTREQLSGIIGYAPRHICLRNYAIVPSLPVRNFRICSLNLWCLTDFTAIPMKYLLTRKSNRYSLGI